MSVRIKTTNELAVFFGLLRARNPTGIWSDGLPSRGIDISMQPRSHLSTSLRLLAPNSRPMKDPAGVKEAHGNAMPLALLLSLFSGTRRPRPKSHAFQKELHNTTCGGCREA